MDKTDMVLKVAGFSARMALDSGLGRQEALEESARVVGELLGDSPQVLGIAGMAPAIGLAWCEEGFPCVEIGDRLAASLMCTGISASGIGEVIPPWRCFAVRFCPSLLGFSVAVVLVSRSGEVWVVRDSQQGASGGMFFGFEKSISAWAELEDYSELILGENPIPENEWAAGRLLGRLIVGACIEMAAHRPSPINERVTVDSMRRKPGPPASWTFRLSRPVKLDVRDAVREWMAGTRGGSLSLQHMVRGHHKMQPHGIDGAQRKWIHIEPYWRGDPDAPIALRSHLMDDPRKS